MKNKELIEIFNNLESKLLQNITDNFYYGVNFNSENDIVNDFLTRYIKLKQNCQQEINELSSSALVGKSIVVTGGSSGIGDAIVNLCKQLQAKVIVLDIKPPQVDDVLFIKCDVAKIVDVQNSFRNIEKIDYLITCAGLFGFDENMSQIEKERMFDVNVE